MGRPEQLAEGPPARPLVHAAGRAAVHARRDHGRRAQGGDPAPEGRHRHALHPARREPREPGRGGCGRGPLPRADRPDRGRRDPRRDLGQADAAGPRPRPGRLPRERPPPGRARGRRRLVPVDRHGGQRLHRGDHRALRAGQGGPAEDRHLPAGVPQAHRRRHRAAAAPRPGDPAGQGRLRRAGGDRLSRPPRGRRQLPRARGPVPARRSRASRSAWASARTTSR